MGLSFRKRLIFSIDTVGIYAKNGFFCETPGQGGGAADRFAAQGGPSADPRGDLLGVKFAPLWRVFVTSVEG